MVTCIAYTEDGALCRQPATVLDRQLGGRVCDAHAPACTCPPGWPMSLHIRCPIGHESDVERHYSHCALYNPRLHAASSWCPVPNCIGNARARRAVRPTDPSEWDVDGPAR